jgi:uncharacterized protein (TIGR02145 family)
MAKWLSYVILIQGIILFLLSGCEKGEDSPDPVSDIDGNIYQTVAIGNQVWMAENLRTTKLNDGTEIKMISKNQEWHYTTAPAFSWYNNDSSLFKVPFGALYNAYVAENNKICPEGWHVPTIDEWKLLSESLGDSLLAGGKLKSEGTTQWHSPNTGADNSSVFTALPSGMRYFEGTFSSLSYFTAYWSSSKADTSSMNYMSLSYLDSKTTFGAKSNKYGFSIRCIRN